MIKKYLSFTLCCLLLLTVNAPLISAQTRSGDRDSAAEIKAYIVKRGTHKHNRVKVKMTDGTKLKGDIGQAGEDSFTLRNSKTGQNSSIAYRDVAKVEKSGLSKGDKIALGVVIGATATAAVVLLRFLSIYCNNEGC